MKNNNPLGFFDEYFLLERLSKLKDPLVKLGSYIDWKTSSPPLSKLSSASLRTAAMQAYRRSTRS